MGKTNFGTVRRQGHKNNDKMLKNILEKMTTMNSGMINYGMERCGKERKQRF